jgi:hypothetical protein
MVGLWGQTSYGLPEKLPTICFSFLFMINSKSKTKKKKISEEQIDDIVISQADDDSEWEESVYVYRAKSASFSLPPDLAARAVFLAHLHREPGVENRIMRVIRERVELEEGASVEAKREITVREKT